MVRTALAAALAAILLGSALTAVTTAPATAAKSNRLGIAKAPDQVLRSGCNNYRFRYRVSTPPQAPWAAEIFLIDPTGDTLTTAAVISGGSKRRGKDKFRFCRASTRPGVFTLRMKVTFCKQPNCRESGAPTERFVKPTKFRIRAPRR